MEIYKDKTGKVIKENDALLYLRVPTGWFSRFISWIIGEQLTLVQAGPEGLEFLGSGNFRPENYKVVGNVEDDPTLLLEFQWMNSL